MAPKTGLIVLEAIAFSVLYISNLLIDFTA